MLDILEPYTAEQFMYWRAAERLREAHEAYLHAPRRYGYAPWTEYEWVTLKRRAAERDAARANLNGRRRLIEVWHEELIANG